LVKVVVLSERIVDNRKKKKKKKKTIYIVNVNIRPPVSWTDTTTITFIIFS